MKITCQESSSCFPEFMDSQGKTKAMRVYKLLTNSSIPLYKNNLKLSSTHWNENSSMPKNFAQAGFNNLPARLHLRLPKEGTRM